MRDHGTSSSGALVTGALAIGLIVAGLLGLIMCSHSVQERTWGILVHKPFFFGKGGVDEKVVIGPDRVYLWPSSSLRTISMEPISIGAHAEDFNSANQVPLDFDFTMTFKVTSADGARRLVSTLGGNPEQVFRTLLLQQGKAGTAATGEVMSHLRDEVKHRHSAEFIAALKADGTPSDATPVVEKSPREFSNTFLAQAGADMLKVDSVALGRANPPDGVKAAIAATAAASQDEKTQIERRKAQISRREAEIASASADRAYQEELKLPLEAWLQLKQLEAQKAVCGNGNCTFVFGGNAGTNVQIMPKR